jgi:UDP-4-amino-4,6-dideoxy-N-acetyl-beta-L-altrosamine transaminase
MSYIPYSRQDIDGNDVAAVVEVLRSDYLTQGPAVSEFERAFAERHQVAHAVAVSNATSGLHLACLALEVGPGARVWTSPNSFLASANCALYCGAKADFVDVDPHTRNMSVAALADKLERAAARAELPQVVIPVDFSGLPCDLREIRALADRYGFRIIEDASHATGATYLGRPAGSAYADLAVFSFHAVKIVTTAEGGIVTAQDAALDKRLRLLRSHGMTRDPNDMMSAPEGPWVYEQHVLGFNYRMTDLHAALGRSQLHRLDAMQRARRELAERYDTLLSDLPLIRPARLHDRESAWHLYVVEVDDTRTARSRAEVFTSLRSAGIGVNVHYIPIHTQPYYAALGFRAGDYPAAERYYARAISLPLYPALTHAQQDRIAASVREALQG